MTAAPGAPAAPDAAEAPAPRGQGRSSARLACVQALYQIEMSGQSADEVIEEFLNHRAGHEIDGERYAAPHRRHFERTVREASARARSSTPWWRRFSPSAGAWSGWEPWCAP